MRTMTKLADRGCRRGNKFKYNECVKAEDFGHSSQLAQA